MRLLALALYRSGRQGDALGVLRRARAHLADELGVDPGPALRRLEADVLDQAPELDRPDDPSGTGRPRTGARARPRRSATPPSSTGCSQVAEAADGVRLVWLAGDPGAGKTTLAEAVTSSLRSRGWSTAWGRCPEVDGAPPGWAWTEVSAALSGRAPEPAASTAPSGRRRPWPGSCRRPAATSRCWWCSTTSTAPTS